MKDSKRATIIIREEEEKQEKKETLQHMYIKILNHEKWL